MSVASPSGMFTVSSRQARLSKQAFIENLAALVAVAEDILGEETLSVPGIIVTSLKKMQAKLCKEFDTCVTFSNSTTATYHTLVEKHGECERLIKEVTSSSNSNVNTGRIQILQLEKAQIEQIMLFTEEVQHQIWQALQEVQLAYKETIGVIERFEKRQGSRPEIKADEVEGDSDSEPGQAE